MHSKNDAYPCPLTKEVTTVVTAGKPNLALFVSVVVPHPSSMLRNHRSPGGRLLMDLESFLYEKPLNRTYIKKFIKNCILYFCRYLCKILLEIDW